MTRRQAFFILELKEGASLTEVKQAYRKLAFSLHPDLNPNVPEAARRFQLVNEAYVYLNEQLAAESTSSTESRSSSFGQATAKAREEAKRAYEKMRSAHKRETDSAQKKDEKHATTEGNRREDILRNILSDPFARRVFEDIYSHISKGKEHLKQAKQKAEAAQAEAKAQPAPVRRSKIAQLFSGGLTEKLGKWAKRQIDEEQVLRLPGEALMPGARVCLQIRHGFNDELQTVEVVLPPDFSPGKTIRLKGMGKRVGRFHGDLYVKIEPV